MTLPLVLVGMFVRPSFLKRHAPLLFLLALGLLLAVFVVGVERNNARRWIQLPGFDLGAIQLHIVVVPRQHLTDTLRPQAPGPGLTQFLLEVCAKARRPHSPPPTRP